jgi:hypothetical protein
MQGIKMATRTLIEKTAFSQTPDPKKKKEKKNKKS